MTEAAVGESVTDLAPPPANIRIETVRVDGFRALRQFSITLEAGTTVLVGENNTGKTSLLEALATALGGRRADDDDLHMPPSGDRATAFIIDLTLVPESGGRFDQPVATVFGNAVQRGPDDREYVAIRTEGSAGLDGSGPVLRRSFLANWHDGDAAKASKLAQPGVKDPVLKLLVFSLLDASRDLAADLRSRRSEWGRLVAGLDIDPALRANIETALGQLGHQIVTGSSVLTRLRDELQAVQQALSTVSSVTLSPLPARVDELARAIEVLVAAPGGAPLPLRMQGLGSRGLAKFMVFRAFASTMIGAGTGIGPHRVSAFEEPEAHLHPQAQVALAGVIEEIPGQRLISTHSPQLASVADLSSIRLLRRTGTTISVRAPTGLSPEDLIKVRRLVERPYGEVLFARLVIIGDGATERAGLPVFARAHWGGIEPEGKCVSIIDPGGLSQAAPVVKVLEDLGIAWLILADGDEAAVRDLATIGERLDAPLDAASPNVVLLPDGQAWEPYLLAEGLREPMEKGIASLYGATALDEFRSGGNRSKLDPDQLVLRFLNSRKGSHGRATAEAIIAVLDGNGRPTIPEKIRNLFERADELLAAGP